MPRRHNTTKSGTSLRSNAELPKQYRQPNITFWSAMNQTIGNITQTFKNSFQLFGDKEVTKVALADLQADPELDVSEKTDGNCDEPNYVGEVPYQFYDYDDENAPKNHLGSLQLYTCDYIPNPNNTARIYGSLNNALNPSTTPSSDLNGVQVLGVVLGVGLLLIVGAGLYFVSTKKPEPKKIRAKVIIPEASDLIDPLTNTNTVLKIDEIDLIPDTDDSKQVGTSSSLNRQSSATVIYHPSRVEDESTFFKSSSKTRSQTRSNEPGIALTDSNSRKNQEKVNLLETSSASRRGYGSSSTP